MTPEPQSLAAPPTDPPRPAVAETAPSTAYEGPAGPSVLVVDDNDELRASLAAAIAEEGLAVATAAGANEAMALVERHRFDAAVIDLVMPGRHGLALLADLRDLPNGRRLSAVVLSILPEGETREQARTLVGKATNAAFLDKPVTPRRLLITLGRLLATR